MSPRSLARPVAIHSLAALTVMACAVTVAAGAPATAPVSVGVLENTPQRITLEFQFPDYVEQSVTLDGQPYSLIVFPHEALMLTAGAPALPHVARSVIIPATGGVQLAIDAERSVYHEVTGVNIVPSKGNLDRSVNPADVPYSFDDAIYGTDAFFPGSLAQLGEPYVLRDYRGVAVDIFPIQYNPVTQTLRVYSTLIVTVIPDKPGDIAEPNARSGFSLLRSFDEIYKAHFVNYAPGRYAPLDEDGNMLIICYDAWIPNVQPLVNHKNGQGTATTAVGVSTIGSTSTAIKSYIQNLYNTTDLAYVLLVGGPLNGPTLGGILAVAGVGAFGKHLKNILPIFAGVIIGGLTKNWNINDPSILFAALFGTSLAPIAGHYGWFWGVVAGFVN